MFTKRACLSNRSGQGTSSEKTTYLANNMRILIDLDKPHKGTHYPTKEDWDKSHYSQAAYIRNMNSPRFQHLCNKGQRPMLDRAATEPHAFPCVAFEAGYRKEANGDTTTYFLFIYDFHIFPETGIPNNG